MCQTAADEAGVSRAEQDKRRFLLPGAGKWPTSIHIMANGNNQLNVVGELKAHDDEELLQARLAQPIKYMQELNCMYGFVSNYEETIFLRQQLINGT
jgi:hypothetical protein